MGRAPRPSCGGVRSCRPPRPAGLGLVGFGLGGGAARLLTRLLTRLGRLLLLAPLLGGRLLQGVAEVAEDGARGVLGLGRAETELHRFVAVRGRRLHLRDGAGAGLDDGDGDRGALGAENLGHAHFSAQHCAQHAFSPAARETRRQMLVAHRACWPVGTYPRDSLDRRYAARDAPSERRASRADAARRHTALCAVAPADTTTREPKRMTRA